MAEATNTTRVSPTSAPIFRILGRLPLPRPLKGNGRTAIGGVVANEGDICVLVEVRIGVEFPGHESFHLSGRGGMDIGERIDAGI